MIIHGFSREHQLLFDKINTGQAHLSFSQLGEDALIWHHFHAMRDGFYVDVGCHDPYRFSNTALLHVFNNWSGINIDADIRAIEQFRVHRPNDINLHVGVGQQAGTAAFFVFEDGAVNSFSPEQAKAQEGNKGVCRPVEVPVRPLRDILADHLPHPRDIDLLNVDIEGYDHQALLSHDWHRYPVKMICVESHDFSLANPQQNQTFQLLTSLGYGLIGHTLVTSIYLRP